MSRALWIGGLFLGAGLAAAGVMLYASKAQADAVNPPSKALTLSSGSSTLTGVRLGSQVAISPPANAILTSLSVDGHPYQVGDGMTPITVTLNQNTGTITATWATQSGPQNASIAYGA